MMAKTKGGAQFDPELTAEGSRHPANSCSFVFICNSIFLKMLKNAQKFTKTYENLQKPCQ